MTYRIDALRAPLFVSWQLTRDCDLCCLHCCTESAPGKRLRDELDADAAMRLAEDVIRTDVPYVMLCGGEPLVVPHFFAIAEKLGKAGINLKIETNGQRFDAAIAKRLSELPIRSIQISLDGDSEEVYRRQRPGGSLAKAHGACRAVRAAGLPLEVTFAPTRLNIHEGAAVIKRARELGAFRFNSGSLMRVGTAARLWDGLVPSADEYRRFRGVLDEQAQKGGMELCYLPFSLGDALRSSLDDPPATLLVLPNGNVKVAAPLPHLCADLRTNSLAEAWERYRAAWHDGRVLSKIRRAIEDEASHAEANRWMLLSEVEI